MSTAEAHAETFADRVNGCIIEACGMDGIPVEQWTDETPIEQLDMDELGRIEYLLGLEEEFHATLTDDEAIYAAKTLGDLRAYAKRHFG